jgi:hypothetical protein
VRKSNHYTNSYLYPKAEKPFFSGGGRQHIALNVGKVVYGNVFEASEAQLIGGSHDAESHFLGGGVRIIALIDLRKFFGAE